MSGADDQDVIQWQESLRWLERAAEDVRATRVLLGSHILRQAAFHLQQAVEKTLKALLVAARQDIRKTHDLTLLADLVHSYWPELVTTPFPLAYLSRWYLTSRYPGDDGGTPTGDGVKAALDDVTAFFGSVIAQAPVQLVEEVLTITSNNP